MVSDKAVEMSIARRAGSRILVWGSLITDMADSEMVASWLIPG